MKPHYVYYQKIYDRFGMPRISEVTYRGGKLKPTHVYFTVTDWGAAKLLLQQQYPDDKVFETRDMFKVQLKLPPKAAPVPKYRTVDDAWDF